MALRPVALIAIALTLSGCGLSDPYEQQQAQNTSSTARSSTTTSTGRSVVPATSSTTATAGNPGEHDEGAPPPNRVRLGASVAAPTAPTAQGALEHFTRLYINWTASQLPARSRQLADLATGQAQAQSLALAARADVLCQPLGLNSGWRLAVKRFALGPAGRPSV